jgi:hypothetical protein
LLPLFLEELDLDISIDAQKFRRLSRTELGGGRAGGRCGGRSKGKERQRERKKEESGEKEQRRESRLRGVSYKYSIGTSDCFPHHGGIKRALYSSEFHVPQTGSQKPRLFSLFSLYFVSQRFSRVSSQSYTITIV